MSPRRDTSFETGFNFSHHMSRLCVDMTRRLPALRHIDMSRVLVAMNFNRKPGKYGVHASLTPLRFEGGARVGKRNGRLYEIQQVVDPQGREMLYILRFYLPRFHETEFAEKLVTIVHELWHISPDFDGDIRRHEGRCHVHTGSKKQYDDAMAVLAQEWLSLAPPAELYEFLTLSLEEIAARHGQIFGMQAGHPKLFPARVAVG